MPWLWLCVCKHVRVWRICALPAAMWCTSAFRATPRRTSRLQRRSPIAMPPSKLSAEQRSAKKTQQAAQIALQADLIVVRECMKIHGEVAISACKRSMVQLGFLDGTTNKVIPASEPVKRPHSEATAALKNEPHSEEWKHGMNSTWDSCSVTRLRTLMSMVDPVALSEANIRLLGKRHAKEPQKGMVLLHWEFFFMEDVGYELPSFECERAIVDYLKSKYISAGERASYKPMPLNFKEDGVYKLFHEDGRCTLRHTFMSKTAELLDIDDEVGALPIYLEHNHSDRRATIRIKHTTFSRSCEQVFLSSPPCSSASTASASIADGLVATLVKKRARMSILPGQGMLALPQPSPASARSARSASNSALPLPAPSPAKQAEASPSALSHASASDSARPDLAQASSPLPPARDAPPADAEPPIDEASFIPSEELGST